MMMELSILNQPESQKWSNMAIQTNHIATLLAWGRRYKKKWILIRNRDRQSIHQPLLFSQSAWPRRYALFYQEFSHNAITSGSSRGSEPGVTTVDAREEKENGRQRKRPAPAPFDRASITATGPAKPLPARLMTMLSFRSACRTISGKVVHCSPSGRYWSVVYKTDECCSQCWQGS